MSGVEMPRIRLPDRPEVEKRVNDQFDSLAASLTCFDVEMDGENAWYDTSTVVTYAANDVLSVQVVSSYYCGGAYPTNGADSSMTFDLRTGQAVGFRALFADYEGDGAAIARAYLKRLFPEDLEDCEDVLTVEELDGHYFAYTVSPEGLRLQPAFPQAFAACGHRATLPFSGLRPFAAPGGILVRLADATP